MTNSPDGSTLTPGSNYLTTADGTWAFGTTSPDAGGRAILLNDKPAGGGTAVLLQIANGGHAYCKNALGKWFVWIPETPGWFASAAPPSPSPSPTPTPTPTPTGPLTVTFSGAVTGSVSAANATNLGNFVSAIGGFTQSCSSALLPNTALTVFFRPDVVGDGIAPRQEIVVELGKCFGAANAAAANLGAYTATITQGSVTLATVSVPAHYWFARWRWQSAPRPIVAKIADLIAAGKLPKYQQIPGTSTAPVAPAYTPMGISSITPYMPQTGERDDIGMVTENQGAYIVTGDPIAYGSMIAWAEGGNSFNWCLRDENTLAPLSLVTYPEASTYDTLYRNPAITITTLPNSMVIDSAHEPALAYLPYLLTGDPYYLELLQFQANYDWIGLPPNYRPTNDQVRTMAWTLRNAMQVALITPATVPSWLLPQSYWQGLLAQLQTFMMTFVNDTSTLLTTLFRSFAIPLQAAENPPPYGTALAPWQHEFLVSILGWAIQMGFGAQFKPIFDWAVKSTVDRTNGVAVSGWPQSWSTPYRLIVRDVQTDPYATSWAAAWQLTTTIMGYPIGDGVTWGTPTELTYLVYSRGALCFANQESPGSVTANLAWADQQIANDKWTVAYKWQLAES